MPSCCGITVGWHDAVHCPWPAMEPGARATATRAREARLPVLRRPLFDRWWLVPWLDRRRLQDFDNAEIKRALMPSFSPPGSSGSICWGRCLSMQMLEVAYQVRTLARYVVASQEIELTADAVLTPSSGACGLGEADGAQLGAMRWMPTARWEPTAAHAVGARRGAYR